ncbi:MAG: hypothetical protein ACJ72N_06950 [Labedaea sp.]
MKAIPDRDEIAARLIAVDALPVAQANTWADYLAGLPRCYIDPLIRIAVAAHHQHPAAALAYALRDSDDPTFVEVATAHVKAKAEG